MDSDSETGDFSPSIFIRPRAAGRTRFPSGDIVATPGAIENVGSLEMSLALTRHLQGDWGDLDKEDIATNNRAIEYGGRLFSAYKTRSGTKFWIITEADRSATTILLPQEY